MISELKTPRMETLKSAAALFGLSYYAVRNLVLSGKVPATRLGGIGSHGKLLVNCDKLAAYLNSSTANTQGQAPAVVDGIRVLH